MKHFLAVALGLALAAFVMIAPSIARADTDVIVRPVVIERPVILADRDDRPFIGEHALRGTVTYFNAFSMTVRADGRYIPVALHQGTIINPTGTTLVPGMFINVFGYWQTNGKFHADQIGLVH